MKLSEIIAAVGDEHIQLQNLLDSTASIQMMKNGDTKISFFTGQITATEVMNGTAKKLGLVIWLPWDRLPPEIKRR
jgi:hypothetical protein